MSIKKPRKKVGTAPKKKTAPSVEFSAKDTDTAAPKTAKKKAPVKKVAAKAPAKKTPVKKAPAATAPKKKVAKKNASGRSLPRDLNEHGFVKGSNSEAIVEAMLTGGDSRADVADRLRKTIKSTDGKEVNTPALMSGLLHRLEAKGYTIEQSWKLLPPTPASKAKATRAAKKAVPKKK